MGNAIRVLRHLKEVHRLCPVLVTCDLSPQMMAAVVEVWGEEVLQIDPFHVMQSLTRAVRVELGCYRRKKFVAETNELRALRNFFDEIRKVVERPGNISGIVPHQALKKFPTISPSHVCSSEGRALALKFTGILAEEDPNRFFDLLNTILGGLEEDKEGKYDGFCKAVRKTFPKRAINEKRRRQTALVIVRKLKKHILAYRKVLQEESKRFFREKFVIFKNPEGLIPETKQMLKDFLIKYPELRDLRELVVRIGEIYRQPLAEADGHQIDDLVVKHHYCKELKGTIKNLKRLKPAVIRFAQLAREWSDMPKACRANMEWMNSRIKAPFRAGNHCTGPEHLKMKLECQLGCEVRIHTG